MANRKEILFQTLRHEKPEQTPWVPFTGVHAGRIAGYTATEQLTDGDKLYNSLTDRHRRCRRLHSYLYKRGLPDGISLPFCRPIPRSPSIHVRTCRGM